MLAHLVAASDQVHEHTQERHEDDEDHPEELRHPREVMAAEDVGEDGDEQPDPDEEQEEPEHRPEHLASAPLGSDDGHGHDLPAWWASVAPDARGVRRG